MHVDGIEQALVMQNKGKVNQSKFGSIKYLDKPKVDLEKLKKKGKCQCCN